MVNIPRVMHVVLTLDGGGLERVVLDLAASGHRLGQQVIIVCIEHPGPLAAEAAVQGIPVLCVHKRPGFRPATIARLAAMMRDFAPDVVHTHQVGSLMYAGLAARRERIATVVHTEHNNHFAHQRWKTNPTRLARMLLLWRFAARFAQRFVCVSEDIARIAVHRLKIPASQVMVILNGIDLTRFADIGVRETTRRSLGISPDACVVGTIGRLTQIKRQDLLVRAFAELLGAFPTAHLVIVGDGALMETLRTLVAQLEIGQQVHLVGYQARPQDFLPALDIFVQTSSIEGLPLAILEARAVGLPVVASKVGGLAEVIDHGHDGFLYEFADHDRLVAILSDLMAHPAVARRVGQAGQARVRANHDQDRMCHAYFSIYDSLLAQHRGAE